MSLAIRNRADGTARFANAAGRYICAVCASLILLAGSASAAGADRAPAATMPDALGDTVDIVNINASHSPAQILVPANKSRLIHFNRAFSQINVGSRDVAEVVALSKSTIYVLGKKRGATDLTITDGHNSVVAVLDVVVTYDIDELRRQLAQIVPGEKIGIDAAGDSLVLSGQVSSAEHLRQVSAIAERYAPGAVTNLLTVRGSQQVLLEVKFAEVQRSALQNFGLTGLGGGATNLKSSSPALSVTQTALGSFGGLLTDNSSYFLNAQLQAAETKGLVRTLAEPNLVALSGETASFLAGGQFPIPVAQSLGSGSTAAVITIEFKDFGVGLSFTPTVLSTDTIDVVTKSEVSSIDPTVSVQANGITVPGLKVRRTSTTVELRNGQTFAIAGLLQDDFQNTINQIPGLGELPIIGSLVRSIDFQHNQTELVVFITVHLVQPGDGRNLQLPIDKVHPTDALTAYGTGETETDSGTPDNAPPISFVQPPGTMAQPPMSMAQPQASATQPPKTATQPLMGVLP
jgi:pilus assembly protein CpaC